MEIKVLKDILSANEQIAERNRQLLDSKGVFTVNLMSSPGAGKTSHHSFSSSHARHLPP